MKYHSLRHCVEDLIRHHAVAIIEEQVDPHLEMAAIQRRVYAAGGPALYFRQVKNSPFEAISNLYGTIERTRFIFRATLRGVEEIIRLKTDPSVALKNPLRNGLVGLKALNALPKRSRRAPVMYKTTNLSQLPQIVSWPKDGGAFVTLPQVFSLPPGETSPMKANIGMYRIQMSGNDYIRDSEAGMHYQIHRGIGVHHALYNTSDEAFRVSVFIGGPPAHALAAVMPLPEGLSELTFAGMLAGRRFRYDRIDGSVISCDADFCITGTIQKGVKKPEGPFGDHLGYYSLQHDYPVLTIDKVYHRKDPLWHFTVVGRPPQEDTSFGHIIHEIAGPLLPQEFPGIKEVNAVDASGVHPLLLALGSERYMPFRDRHPEEILTQANHLLGKGQTSLAKYLLIAADGDDPDLSVNNIEAFFRHILSRFDPRRDLHFQTRTTIDTLDYSGTGLNEGSKLVIAACGDVKRKLGITMPESLPAWVKDAHYVVPGILALSAPGFIDASKTAEEIKDLDRIQQLHDVSDIALIVLVDDASFVSSEFRNFLWVTFTRSNPSHDVHGIGAFINNKHWGCTGPLIIDARIKPHHAPVLEEDPGISSRIDRFFLKDAVLGKWG